MKITIRQRPLNDGNQSLYLDFYEKGKRWNEYLGLYLVPDDAENAKLLNENAMKKAVEIKSKRMLGIPKEEEVEPKEMTLKDWLDTYVKELSSRLKPDSLRHFKIMAETIKAYMGTKRKGNMLVSMIDKEFYKGFLSYLKEEYRVKRGDNLYSLTPTSLYNKQRQFNQILNAAVRRGLLAENPFKKLSAKEKYPKISTTKNYLTVEELRLMAKTPTHSRCTKEGFMFCCFTGLRLSDLIALKWGDIRQTDNGQEVRIKAMKKTGREVTIPLNELALSWLPSRKGHNDDEKVYNLPERTTCRVSIKSLAKRAGITKDICFHTSRRTFATLTLTAGSDLFTVSKLLGHTSVKTTQIYADVAMDTKVATVNLVKGAFH